MAMADGTKSLGRSRTKRNSLLETFSTGAVVAMAAAAHGGVCVRWLLTPE